MIENRPLKTLKFVLAALYALYFINVVINNVYSDIGITNGLIEEYKTFGYFLTCAINFLVSGAFFVILTVVQIIVYSRKNLPPRNKITALTVIEAIKIVGTAVCVFAVDLPKLIFNGFDAQIVFLITGIVLFVVVFACEIAVLVFMNIAEKRNSEGA